MSEEKRSDPFARLVAQQPENELFRFNFAQALVSEHRYTDAAEHYRFCVKKKAEWLAARIQLAKVLLDLGQHAEARLHLQEALKIASAQQNEEAERELRDLLAATP